MEAHKHMEFNPDKARAFARAYNAAHEKKQASFIFDGGEFIDRYAYYLIQYLQMNHLINGKFTEDKLFKIKP